MTTVVSSTKRQADTSWLTFGGQSDIAISEFTILEFFRLTRYRFTILETEV